MGTRSKGDWWRYKVRSRELIEERNAGWLPAQASLTLKPRCGKHRKFRRLRRRTSNDGRSKQADMRMNERT